MARPGPRPGGADTRADILDAARAAFASDGFTKATIRRIATDAGVDPALVHHYFGSKADLYAATIEIGVVPSEIEARLDSVPVERLGEVLVGLFLSVWEVPESRSPLLAMLGGAMTGHEMGLRAFREFLVDRWLSLVAHRLDGPDVELRLTLAAGHLVGTAVLRYVVRLEPLASASPEVLARLVAPRVQSYLTPGAGSAVPGAG